MAPPHGAPPGGSSGGFRPAALAVVPAYDLVAVLILYLLGQRLLPYLFFSPAELGGMGAEAASSPGIAGLQLFLASHSLLMLAAIYVVIVKRHGLRLADLGIVLVSRSWFLQAVAFGITIFFIVGLLSPILQSMRDEPFHNPQIDLLVGDGLSFNSLLPSLLVTGMLVPLFEEVAFRGLFYGWLRSRVSFAMAVAISSGVFAFFHGIPFLFPVFAVIGVALALITEKSGSVLAASVTHGVFNSINMLVLYSVHAYDVLPQ